MNPWMRFAIVAMAASLGSCEFITKSPTEVEGISGTLVREDGRPAGGVLVRVYPALPASGTAKAATHTLVTAADSVSTNTAGAFNFSTLPDGVYNIAATMKQGDTTLSLYMAGLQLVKKLDLGVDTLYVSGILSVQVKTSGGAPLTGALCAVAGGAWVALSDSSGQCAISGVPPGTYQVTITHGSYQEAVTADVTVTPGGVSAGGSVTVVSNGSGLPAAPLLLAPGSGAVGVTRQPALRWQKVPVATSYHVQVATDAAFTGPVLNDSGFADTLRAAGTLAYGAQYYWRARAKSAAGAGPWSATWSFTTETLQSTVNPKLVAYYDFNEGSGTSLTDKTGKGHTGSIEGATWTTGVQGGALSFNGSSNQVTVAYNPDLNLRQFTISAWIKTTRTSTFQSIISRQPTGGTSVPWNYRLMTTEAAVYPNVTMPPGHAFVDFNTNPQSPNAGPVSTIPVADGEWHMLTGIQRGTMLELYVDGVLNFSRDMLAYPETTSTEILRLGRSSFSGYPFLGTMDEVRIYDGPMSPAQVDSLYRAFAPAQTLVLPASQDADIVGSHPGTSTYIANATTNYGKRQTMAIGVYDLNTVTRVLVQFALPTDVTGAKISKATIRLHSTDWVSKNVRPDSVSIRAYRLLRQWKEGNSTDPNGIQNSATMDGVTALERFWGAQDGSEDWSQKLIGLNDIDAASTATARVAKSPGYVGAWDFDVTTLAKTWADNPAQNFGVLFATDIPASNPLVEDYPWFHSKDGPVADSLKPQLILNFN